MINITEIKENILKTSNNISERIKFSVAFLLFLGIAISVSAIRYGATKQFSSFIPEIVVVFLTVLVLNIKFCTDTTGMILILCPTVLFLLGRSTQIIYSKQFSELNKSVFSSKYVYIIIALALLTGIFYPFFKSLLNYTPIPYILYAVTILLFFVTLIFGKESNNAKNWLYIGGTSIQLSEISKLLLVISFASVMNNQRWKEWLKYIVVFVLAFSCGILLFIQNELGTILNISIIFGTHILVYTKTRKACVIMIAALLVFAIILGMTFYFLAYNTDIPYMVKIRERIEGMKNSEDNKHTSAYQIVAGKEAMGQGGYIGTFNDIHYIPVYESDMIYPAFVQLYGIIWGYAIIIMLFIYMIAGVYVAKKSDNYFDSVVALELTVLIFTQSMIIIGGSTGIIPLSGITFPFMSHGGSSLLVCFISTGLLIRINNRIGKTGNFV